MRAVRIVFLTLSLLTAGAVAAQQEVELRIDRQPMAQALAALAAQTGMQLIFPSVEIAKNLNAPAVIGKYTPRAALKILLADSGLKEEWINERTVAIRAAGQAREKPANVTSGAAAEQTNTLLLAQVERTAAPEKQKDDRTSDDSEQKGIPEILVQGKRSLNTDIQRTEDAPQPYVVFSREEIQRSQATTLEDFLRTRLPMNTAQSSNAQITGQAMNKSSINLRGLGENQTLILVDGRRMPGVAQGPGTPTQPDINGIPVTAIERIEVLPSTAGGIYGGSATGGVVNIIMRRDFRGLEAQATYNNTFDTDAANTRLDINGGLSLEDGRTTIMVNASRSEANQLLVGDRDFSARGVALLRANNPINFTTLTTPPLGATINILSGNVVAGVRQPLQLDAIYGGTVLPSTFTHFPMGYAGASSDNAQALRNNAGRYNLDLPAGMNGRERGLMSAPTMESASLNVRREFTSWLDAFVDVSTLNNYGRSFTSAVPSAVTLAANAPNNPFQQAIVVSFPTPGFSFESTSELRSLRATGGLIVRLPLNWMGELSYAWSKSRFEAINTASAVDNIGVCVLGRGVAANVILGAPGPATACSATDTRPALNVLQEGNTNPIDFGPYLLPSPNNFLGPYNSVLKDASMRLSGPVVSLPGGAVTLSMLLERREDLIEDVWQQSINVNTRALIYRFAPERQQDIDSAYVEARIPLFSETNALPFMRDLELQASLRRDEYRTNSVPSSVFVVPSRDGPFPNLTRSNSSVHSTDYTLGFRYQPLESITLRGSLGTGFLPPTVSQIAQSPGTISGSLVTDPLRGGTPNSVGVAYTLILGGNPNLRPEQSESISMGVIFTPTFAPGFRFSVDYTKIDKLDEILQPDFQYVVDNEANYPGRIIRGPKRAIDDPTWAGPITTLDSSMLNIAETSVEAYDFQADYLLSTKDAGDFRIYTIATWQPHYRNRSLPDSPMVDSAGFTGFFGGNGSPLEWRGNMGVDWYRGPVSVSWNAQYYNSYWIYSALPTPLLPFQVTARATAALNQGSARIPRQMYHDLIASYRFEGENGFGGSWLANSEVSLGIRNLFDKLPPILATTDPAGQGYSTYGDPRLRQYSISLRKSFGGR